MNKRNMFVASVLCGGLIAGSPAPQADNLDQLLARGGQFELSNSKTKTLTQGGEIKKYRVCMEEGAGAMSLKVTHDDNETIVESGECQLFEARSIKLATASRLKDDMTLIGTFNSGSTKRFHTSVNLARATR